MQVTDEMKREASEWFKKYGGAVKHPQQVQHKNVIRALLQPAPVVDVEGVEATAAIKWLKDCSKMFSKKSSEETEDMAVFAGIYNAENCNKIIELIKKLSSNPLQLKCVEPEGLKKTAITDGLLFSDDINAEYVYINGYNKAIDDITAKYNLVPKGDE